MDKVSVIIPSYNRDDLVVKCLLSLNAQSCLPDEVVIADDGSKKDILGAVRAISGELNFRIVYVSHPHDGFRAAKVRNNGIRHASGDYLIFSDQDVVHTRHYIRTFLEHRRRGQFLVAYPVRLTEEQSIRVTEEMIRANTVDQLVSAAQRRMIRKQYRKDGVSYFFRKTFRMRGNKPKLRSGFFGVYREDLWRVNGFDEWFRGWGNEDDDLGRRLHRAGILGRNPFRDEFPIHLWHEPNHTNGFRANAEYNELRIHAIRNGDIRAVNGLENSLDPADVRVIRVA